MNPIIVSLIVLVGIVLTFLLKTRKKKCVHDKNYHLIQYLDKDRTPMTQFVCYDCGYSDQGHVHGNPEEMEKNWTKMKQVIDGKEIKYEET